MLEFKRLWTSLGLCIPKNYVRKTRFFGMTGDQKDFYLTNSKGFLDYSDSFWNPPMATGFYCVPNVKDNLIFGDVISLSFKIYFNCFTDPEDSATLGSDTSAVSGLREAVCRYVYCFFAASWKPKALNPGVRGRAPAILLLC